MFFYLLHIERRSFYGKKVLLIIMSLLLTLVISVTAGQTAEEYKPVSNLAQLEISFANPEWDGKNIPITRRCGSPDASTPRLIVNNIPSGSNAIIMEYSDKDWPEMDDGGHGKIGYRIAKGTTVITVPSVPANTFDLPDGFFLVDAHQGPSNFKAGAYMPPCSGGMGNLYDVTVKAVYKASSKEEESKLLGIGKIDLGRF